MSYDYITQYDSPNFTRGEDCPAVFGYSRGIDSITIHWWGDPKTKPSFQGVVDYLCRNNGSSSAHEVIEAGRVACIVNHDDAAWHAGNSKGNARSLGLELNPRASDEDYETAGERIADLWRMHGKKPLVPHSSWKNTACPGTYSLTRLNNIAEKYYNGGSTPTPTPKPDAIIPEDEMFLIRHPKGAVYLLTPNGKAIAVSGTDNYGNLQKGGIGTATVDDAQFNRIVGAYTKVG